MELLSWRRLFMTLLVALTTLGMIGGCESGKEVVDEITGNRAVKQYHKTKKDIEKIADQQAERYKGIPDDNDEEDAEE